MLANEHYMLANEHYMLAKDYYMLANKHYMLATEHFMLINQLPPGSVLMSSIDSITFRFVLLSSHEVRNP